MEYKIISVEKSNESLITTVLMTLSNGTNITVDIAHFRPKDISEINQNIVDRLLTEQSKLDVVQTLESLSSEIVLGEVVVIN